LRFGFTGQTDGAIEIGAIVVVAVNIVLWATCYVMFKTGYKIKD